MIERVVFIKDKGKERVVYTHNGEIKAISVNELAITERLVLTKTCDFLYAENKNEIKETSLQALFMSLENVERFRLEFVKFWILSLEGCVLLKVKFSHTSKLEDTIYICNKGLSTEYKMVIDVSIVKKNKFNSYMYTDIMIWLLENKQTKKIAEINNFVQFINSI